MNDNNVLHLRNSDEQDMQCEESTIDDSSIQPTRFSTPSNDWNGQQNTYTPSSGSYSKSHSKGSKKVKSEDDEDIEIDNYINADVQRIPVKTLRKIIPKLRIAVYCSDLLVSGKRKLKHLWDERPADWPQNIPFKDPNNACKDVKKPGKDELGPMFTFLKQKYVQLQGNQNQPVTSVYSSESEYTYGQQVMTESSNDREAAFYSSVSSNPILPQIASYDQPTSDHNSFVITPKREPSAYVDISDLMKQERLQPSFPMAPQLVSLPLQGNAVIPVKPQPVIELYGRLEKKNEEVVLLCAPESQSLVIEVLRKVHQAVIRKLFDEINQNDTRICLMFLDAGHQMEALLDVMLVLRQVDLQLLDNGCQEIIKKFNTQNVNFVFCPQVVPQLSEKDQMLHSPANSFKSDSDMSDDSGYSQKSPNGLIYDLGLGDLYGVDKHKTDGGLEHLENSAPVQLFKPRYDTNKLPEDCRMGIQKRPLVVTSPSGLDDSKSSFAMVPKGMYLAGEDDAYSTSKLSQEEKVEQIVRLLKGPGSDFLFNPMCGNVFTMDTNNLSSSKECAFEDQMILDDISDIIKGEQLSENCEQLEEQTSELMQKDGRCVPSFCQETGEGVIDRHNQLLPSSASVCVIPSTVEDLTCTDSDPEDADVIISFGQPRQIGGEGGRAGPAGGGHSMPTRPFQYVASHPWIGNRF